MSCTLAKRTLGALAGAVTLLGTASAHAQSAPKSLPSAAPTDDAAARDVQRQWNLRFRHARDEQDRGHTGFAYELFLRLADEALNEPDRRLAREMAAACRAQLERTYGPRIVLQPNAPAVRTSEELSVLYTTAFVYGLGTGAWFVLEARPSSVATAVAPFAGITIASVGAVSIVDRYRPFEAGVPQAIAAGTYLGLGQAVWVVGYQAARAARIKNETGYDTTWHAPTAATVLWAGATGGAALGTLVGIERKPSPGRVSFTMSAAIWSGAIFGFGSAALLPSDRRVEHALVIGGGAYNAGMLTALASSSSLSPSLTRVRLVDLGGITGGLLGASTYLVSNRSDQRDTFGATAIGAAAGLGIAWALTSGMQPAEPTAAKLPNLQYALVPTAGGMEIRAGYTM